MTEIDSGSVNRPKNRPEHRVCFDFEITFANGGAIQGQDFRLDIAGCAITDDALAAHPIRDMRLLMVGSVRILNKRIIQERNKRDAAPRPASGSALHSMTTLRGYPGPLICDFLSREASRHLYEPGTEFHIGRIDMVGNTGTYLDTPFHRYADGTDLAALDLGRVSDVPAVVVRVLGMQSHAINWMHFAALNCRGKAVLVHTRWDRHWGSAAYFDGHPHLTTRGCRIPP